MERAQSPLPEGLRVAIMQPYFLPYIGYFQLMSAVDVFVIYDNIKYTKKGWINRNRFLLNGEPTEFALPLKKDSDFLDVRDRRLAADFDSTKILNRFQAAYRKAPQFEAIFPQVEAILRHPESNLFDFIHHSVQWVARVLDLRTRLVVSSTLDIDHGLKGQDKVLAVCECLGARSYINAIGGQELYDGASFEARGMELRFIQSLPHEYRQFSGTFVPWLSILDVLMFNPVEEVRELLGRFDLIRSNR